MAALWLEQSVIPWASRLRPSGGGSGILGSAPKKAASGPASGDEGFATDVIIKCLVLFSPLVLAFALVAKDSVLVLRNLFQSGGKDGLVRAKVRLLPTRSARLRAREQTA